VHRAEACGFQIDDGVSHAVSIEQAHAICVALLMVLVFNKYSCYSGAYGGLTPCN
jgi:hypothetical protein